MTADKSRPDVDEPVDEQPAAHKPASHLATSDGPTPDRWRRLRSSLHPRTTRGQALAAILVAALGFALVAQISQRDDQRLTGLRQSELVQILDNIGDRRDRLADEQSDLEAEQRQLSSGANGAQAAIDAAQQRLDTLGILAGTVGAEGTGVEVFVSDPQGQVRAAQVLDLVEELRDAGAEAIQVGDARVVASTAFTDVDGGIAVGGVKQKAPYTVLAIGDSQTMSTALEIPGGVIASLPKQAKGTVAEKDNVRITVLLPAPERRYAQPAETANPSK
ncbi:DUF881 domain-containing protein [Angustibacter sp. McL0619]|uniref:DUF881 domain-containing protein n=1 Tax=Angustibacter sp. McL0619 TaxID=3415676 RepID=UPI003CEF54BC